MAVKTGLGKGLDALFSSSVTEVAEEEKIKAGESIVIEGVVLTMNDARTNLSNQVISEVKKYFKDNVYKTIIPRNVKLSEAPSYGMPITAYAPRSKGSKCYEKLANELLKSKKH